MERDRVSAYVHKRHDNTPPPPTHTHTHTHTHSPTPPTLLCTQLYVLYDSLDQLCTYLIDSPTQNLMGRSASTLISGPH